jgi:hypothetical protein
MQFSICNPINLSVIPGFTNLVQCESSGPSEPIDSNNQPTTTRIKINKISCRGVNNHEYNLIRYDKDILSASLVSTYGLCRSVILNGSNKVVCFSPPKSIPTEEFIQKYPAKNPDIIAMEFVEGTMINVFWDPLLENWEIATRNNVGATTSFYKNGTGKTFREMFFEAAKENNLFIEKLNKELCYSFVLQHPENRIVVPFRMTELYLVACYNIVNQEDGQIIVNPHSIIDVMKNDWSWTTLRFPAVYQYEDYTELIQKYASMNTGYYILGVVLLNLRTGERAKIRNPVYEEVRSLRGNQPKLQYQYLCLRKEGKVRDFLNFYPENKRDFFQFREQVHAFTDSLYRNYVSCYIKKDAPLSTFSHQYRTHMFHLHEKYRTELKEKNLFVTNTTAIQYVNQLHPSLLMYCLNYHLRKRVVDFIRADTVL